MSETERRKHRAERDIRYLHNKSTASTIQQPSTSDLPCLYHVAGRCEHSVCIYNHQMRLPRELGLCRFYVLNKCTRGNACTRMHSDFPCKFYYLNMPHPLGIDADKCRFMHGNVLNEKTKRFFVKHIEVWVKKRCAMSGENAEEQMNEMMTRFDEQQQRIQEQKSIQSPVCDLSGAEASTSLLTPAPSPFHGLLNEAQIRRLSVVGCDSFHQLRNMSMEELEDHGLTINQIYQIKMKKSEVDEIDENIEAIPNVSAETQSETEYIESTPNIKVETHIKTECQEMETPEPIASITSAEQDENENEDEEKKDERPIAVDVIEKRQEEGADGSDSDDGDDDSRLVIIEETC